MIGEGGVVTFKWQGIVRIIPRDEVRGIDSDDHRSMKVLMSPTLNVLTIMLDPEHAKGSNDFKSRHTNERHEALRNSKLHMVDDLLDGAESRILWKYDDETHLWVRSEGR